MLADADSISSLQTRLAIHRRTIAYLEEQRAQFGSLAPVHIRHQLDEARQQVALVKDELRTFGVVVDDELGDIPSDLPFGVSLVPNVHLPPYQRMVIDRFFYLSLEGLSNRYNAALPLADIYVERTLAPLSAGAAPTTLAALMDERRVRVLIEGELGSGKSVLLRRLALACAGCATGNDELASLFTQKPDVVLLPLLIDARELAEIMDYPAGGASNRSFSGFWDMLEVLLRRDGLNSLLPTIEQALRLGNCLVLVDGLDDVAEREQGRLLLTALGRFIARYPDSRYVVTCRHAALLSLGALGGFTHYTLPPFDDEQIDLFVERWYRAVNHARGSFLLDDDDSHIALLQGHLRAHDYLHTIASNGLGAALCVLVQSEGQPLPAARGAVYERMIDLLLDRWEQVRGDVVVPSLAHVLGVDVLSRREARLALLQPLALAFQFHPDLSGNTPATMRFTEVEPWLRKSLVGLGVDERRAIEQVIPQLLLWCCHQGILAANDSFSEYAMPWRTLREYLAGLALARQPDFPARAFALANDPRWRETLLLAVHELGTGPRVDTAHEFITTLLESFSSAESRGPHDLLLAAECLLELGAASEHARSLHAHIQEDLMTLMQSGDQPPSERVRAGLLLGKLGDPRFRQMLPPLIRVPGGLCMFGTREGYEDEGPPQVVTVRSFAIGMYPVTNGEYGRFLAEISEHPRPRYWYDPRYNNPSQPVVGVTWNDAVAYCQWLTSKLHRAGLLPRSLVARLPSETEWEKAASWDEWRRVKYRYPWGDEWLPNRANTAEARGTWTTAPVGCFPLGVSPYEVHDMIGNVWEWMATEYASYSGALAPFTEHGSYTLRGSSCASLPTHARCTYRSRLPPSYWRYHLGFRIVLGQPLPPAKSSDIPS